MCTYTHIYNICKNVYKHMEKPSDIKKTRIAYVHILHTYMHACIHAYMHAGIHTYITLPYLALPYLTLP